MSKISDRLAKAERRVMARRPAPDDRWAGWVPSDEYIASVCQILAEAGALAFDGERVVLAGADDEHIRLA